MKAVLPIPTILQPKFLSFKNHLRQSFHSSRQGGRDSIIFVLSILLMYWIFRGTAAGLTYIQESEHLAYLHPSLTLGLGLLVLFGMLVFSNCVSALGSLFLAHDLELILAAPLSPRRLFSGKLLEIMASSSWMVLVFGVPVLCAFGAAYDAGVGYYFWALVMMLPYFALPSACALLIVSIFATIVPANRTKPILFVIMIMFILMVYLLASILRPEATAYSINDLLRIISMLSVANVQWSPTYWIAGGLGSILVPNGESPLTYLVLSYSSLGFCIGLAYIAVRLLHKRAYSRSKNIFQAFNIDSRRAQRVLVLLLSFVNQPFRAIIAKEFKLFSRDMAQAVQLMLLMAICMLYLYNFRLIESVEGLPDSVRRWWHGILTICNVAMGAFVITAVSTRFVFSSVSLEGRCFWLLHVSPMTMHQILRAKFWAWFVPVATISSVVLASGALAINADVHIVLLSAVCSWIICYGIVGLAIGLGAYFAHFDWEHSSQLAASLGSLLFMLASTGLIVLNLVPTGMMIFLRSLRNSDYPFTAFDWYASVGCCAGLIVYLNFVTTRWALRFGADSLKRSLN